MIRKLKNAFISGIFVLLPLGITFFVIRLLLDNVGNPASSLFFGHFSDHFDKRWISFLFSIISIFVVVILVTLCGWFSNYFFGKWLLGLTERLIHRIPFINNVYKTVKQIVDTLGQDKKAVFKKAVLVEFPRKEIYSIGFLTNLAQGEVQSKTNEEVYNVFVPTTPNPTSGFLVMVPKKNVIQLEMSIGDAMKAIISGGAVVPPYPDTMTMDKSLETAGKSNE